jgi:glycolate oxidase
MTSPGFNKYMTTEEIIHESRKNLAKGPWDYLVGGSESETTMRRNRLAFDKIAFRPRVLVDVSSIDTSIDLIGKKLRIPVIFAPIGSLQVFNPEGAISVARAAAEFEILHVVSSVTQPELEQTAQSTNFAKVFQLYIHGDWDWTKEMIYRVKKSGYKALCITVDTANYSRRERPMLSRWTPVSQRTKRDPKWAASVTWDLVDKIKEEAGMPLMLKGIATHEDANIAMDHGIEVIWVSNHGGRQLDHGRGTLDVLPEIMDVVNNRAEVIIDGGIQRGSDVLKAVALGAKGVALGKLQGWALSAGGTPALIRLLEIIEDEIRVAMGLIGVTKMSELNQNYVCKEDRVSEPHEMSSWVNKPIGRIV